MENDLTTINNSISNIEENMKIYSKKTIWGFSIFFSAIFGGVLLMQNLKDVGRKKEGNIILILSIIYTAITIYIVNIPEPPKSSLTYLCNMVGGLILTEYFYKKYFPSTKEYEKKKIWKPLIISILITSLFVLALIYDL